MTDSIALPSFYLQQFGMLVEDLGGDFHACLQAANVSPDILDNPFYRGDWLQVERFFGCALEQINNSEMGALFGERLLVHTHGALGYSVMNAATLSEALAVVENFIRIRIGFMRVHIEQNNKINLQSDIPLGGLEAFFNEVVCVALKQALDFICPRQGVVQQVYLPYPKPDKTAVIERVMGCPLHYDATQTQLVLNPSLLELPIRIAEPQAFSLAQKMCADALAELEKNSSMSYRVKRYILSRAQEFPTQEEVSQQLYMTTRTLHRHLLKEGTSYRQIMDEIKSGLAHDYMSKGSYSQQEIAYLLGYSDAANFRRALRRWQQKS